MKTVENIIRAAQELIDAVSFDDSGIDGRGGNGGLISRETIRKSDELRILLSRLERESTEATEPTRDDRYDEGRRDILNAIMALNPPIAAKLAEWQEREPDPEGRLPFDVVFWVTEVASQLGIEPSDEALAAPLDGGGNG